MDNPLRTRDDLQDAVRALCEPLTHSPGGARVKVGTTAAHFDPEAAELEGFARPLWGLAPLAAGGGEYADWPVYLDGLTSGSDPGHAEYWGEARDHDQRLVEMAAIGFALALAPERFWTPLRPAAQQRLAAWLDQINHRTPADNNWHFFRVLVNLGLENVGAPHDPEATEKALDRLEEFYLADGWYSDGATEQRDYYIPFAMHFYGLIYAGLRPGTPRAARFRERAAVFARDFATWFAADGAAVPYGRSLTYRFAQAAFWGALAFAGVEALPWGQVKGLLLRHLRWWRGRPIFQTDGTLSIGYGYASLNMAEAYNSPGSPYWAMKAFLPLALPEDHPFWQAQEEAMPEVPALHALPHARMVMMAGSHVTALCGGQWASWNPRHVAEKYAKFAYSSHFGFSVPTGSIGLRQAAADSMLALSDDGRHWRVREESESEIDGHVVHSRWSPMPGVEVETWLIPHAPWHLRVHRLTCDRTVHSAEGGFAADRNGAVVEAGAGSARAGVSGIVDLGGERAGEMIVVDPNTNLIVPRTGLPSLLGEHPPGEHWLACAVLADPDPAAFEAAWAQPPTAADLPPR
ncbi:MAG: DUF2264 domain-containing protein [Thermoactinospora sp.]|nr:DUF2264 domain-containing protein [Thermoactinospora sp.]